MSASLTPEQLETLLESAAERGAKKALERVGLHDEEAPGDVRDLRGLLDAWRTVRTSILSTVGKAIAVAILAALAFKSGAYWRQP